jgi:hypothetical protein
MGRRSTDIIAKMALYDFDQKGRSPHAAGTIANYYILLLYRPILLLLYYKL